MERMDLDENQLEEHFKNLMGMIRPTEIQKHVSVISPLERLLKTKPIWFLPEVTREESSKLLNNKRNGNFIIRGSRQPNTFAISIKIGTKQSDKVQHFIILKTDRKVCLEDSDILFDNLVSLVFHYSHTCDELPEKLCLPAVLGAAESLQNLVSLSLLGKSFWTYPMARSDRTSLLVGDNEAFNLNRYMKEESTSSRNSTQSDKLNKCPSQSDQLYHRDNIGTNSNIETPKVIKTPPIAPRKYSLGSNSSPPAARVKSRRKSDSVSLITSPTRAPCVARKPEPHSKEGEGWVTSPVFTNYTPTTRNRKVSVFDGNLGAVKEIHEHDNGDNEDVYEDISEQKLSRTCNSASSLNDRYEDDYAFPVDAINEDAEQNIYEDPLIPSDKTSSALGTGINIRTQRFSDSNMRYGGDVDNNSDIDQMNSAFRNHREQTKRKLSLGVIFRKISGGSLQGGKRKASLQERRLSNTFTKLMNFPTFVKNTLGESYQVDSSSWEFLNKDVEDDCWIEKGEKKSNDHQTTKFINDKHPSKDSLYESEYDSSSTLDSSSSTSDKAMFSASNTV